MAQVIVTVCDACMHYDGDGSIPAETYPVAGYLIDMCKGHATQLTFADGVELAVELGRKDDTGSKPKRTRKPAATAAVESSSAYDDDTDLSCPHGCRGGKPYASLKGKRHHLSSAHGETGA